MVSPTLQPSLDASELADGGTFAFGLLSAPQFAVSIGLAVLAVALVLIAEAMHARRVRPIARLAFGPGARPAPWARAAPLVRGAAVALMVWGSAVLLMLPVSRARYREDDRTARQLLICLDVSPSMMLKDASPASPSSTNKISRAERAGVIAEEVLGALPANARVSVVAFYTDALPIIRRSPDRNLAASMLDGLPYHVAFAPGGTSIAKGVHAALEMAKPWPRQSTTLLVITDGDSENLSLAEARPASIDSVVVAGLGDAIRGTPVTDTGHVSRQEVDVLRRVAAKLGGKYFNANDRSLPSGLVRSWAHSTPEATTRWGMREFALLAVGVGGAASGLLGPALLHFGHPRAWRSTLRPRSVPPTGRVSLQGGSPS